MTRALLALRTSGVSNGTAALEIIAPADRSIRVVEMRVVLAAATASVYGLGRPAAKGIGPTATSFLRDGDASTVRTKAAVAWGTGPSVPPQFVRRLNFPATIGAARTWQFGNGLSIPAGATLVLWNLALNSPVDLNMTVEE